MILTLINLSGCFTTANSAAPVEEVSTFNTVTHGFHTVRKGESLFTIAWRYGRDFKELAQGNNIEPPYDIYPGQKLSLKKVKLKKLKPVRVAKVSKSNLPKADKTKKQKYKKRVAVKHKHAPMKLNHKWLWPVNGKVIKTFSGAKQKNKGIDISGNLGDKVISTADGKVVYSGTGLRGYGKLLIIKHDDKFLSAYAHNDSLLVKEGQTVRMGQTIAKMGKTDSEIVKLHFEIRYQGKPVNPLRYLPKKQV